MKLLQWFKDRVGKKVIADHSKDGKGSVKIVDHLHAEHLHRQQTVGSYSFHHHDDEQEHTPLINSVLLYEMMTAAGSTGPDFGGFGGGTTDGAGAGGSWAPNTDSPSFDPGFSTPIDSYTPSSDSTSFDTPSFDSSGDW